MTSPVTSEPVMSHDMNHYGQMALEHWQRHRPQELAAIEDPQRFFSELGEQVAETVLTRTDQLLASYPQVSGFVARVQQEQTARQTAEDETLREMVYTEPSSEATNPTTTD
ncbi:hypothetical protein [Actinophytocola sp.]|uniref:hypothetical protein n=1 Tax=Actinophytocola sp. TaxID=1872138 RepID=UPI00389A2FD7